VDTGAISPKDIDLFQFADTPEQAFELLRRGLTQNYLLDEAQSGKLTETTKTADGEDLMSGWTVEDFLGPEMAKTSK
jgi:predicted Rossmann-fold nucleotide-binding protein